MYALEHVCTEDDVCYTATRPVYHPDQAGMTTTLGLSVEMDALTNLVCIDRTCTTLHIITDAFANTVASWSEHCGSIEHRALQGVLSGCTGNTPSHISLKDSFRIFLDA